LIRQHVRNFLRELQTAEKFNLALGFRPAGLEFGLALLAAVGLDCFGDDGLGVVLGAGTCRQQQGADQRREQTGTHLPSPWENGDRFAGWQPSGSPSPILSITARKTGTPGQFFSELSMSARARTGFSVLPLSCYPGFQHSKRKKLVAAAAGPSRRRTTKGDHNQHGQPNGPLADEKNPGP